MSLSDFFIRLKGSAKSGHWFHAGDPPNRGGSAAGSGGLSTAGLSSDSSVEDRRKVSNAIGEFRKAFARGSTEDLFDRTDRLMKEFSVSQLPPQEYEALQRYTGSSYKYINRGLRKGEVSSLSASDVSTINGLDKAFENAKGLSKDEVVSRGVNANMESLLTPGTIFQDKGFVSTTIREGSSFGLLTMKIIAPKGTKGIYVEGLSLHAGEKELLLNRNSKFKILQKVGSTIYAEVVND